MERGSSGFPRGSAPRRYQRRTPEWRQALSTDPELRSRQHQSVLQSACSLISCDLVSQGRRVLLDGDRRVHRREQGARHQSRAVRRRHGGRCPRWNDANVQAQSLRTTSEAVLGEILDAWFAAEPSANADDRANIAHVDEIHA